MIAGILGPHRAVGKQRPREESDVAHTTECGGRVVSTPASFSGYLEFESRPSDRLS